ncbi:MAG: nucleoside deaminase [Chitinophagaceae bacterium]|nr:MAG: nucleoside deaminase [Chitinophagaceae bacterium]
MDHQHENYMQSAVELARHGMNSGTGGPFGCVIVKNGEVIARGMNAVTSTNDPTAHAEVVAIRNACLALGTHQLTGCELYTSCEPCPMCLGAIYWARPDKVYYGCTRNDAAEAGFDDDFIYSQLACDMQDRTIPMESLGRSGSLVVFDEWKQKQDKKPY